VVHRTLLRLFVLLGIFVSSFAAAQEALFAPVPAPQVTALAPEQSARLDEIRQNPATVSADLVRINAGALTGDAALLALPGLGTQRVDRIKIIVRSPTDYTWFGNLAGGQALFVVRDGTVTGTVWNGANVYTIKPFDGDTHALIRLDATKFPRSVLPDAPETPTSNVVVPQTGAPPASPIQVDVLVAYTSAALAGYGANFGTVTALASEAVDAMNLALHNDQIDTFLHMRLVGTLGITYSEAGKTYDTVLADLIAGTDPQMALVHSQRDALGADVVFLITDLVDINGTDGQAATIGANASNAYAAGDYNYVVTQLVLAHEVGHLFGARHQVQVDPSTTPFSYGHAYLSGYGSWGTVMTEPGASNCGQCYRIQWYSTSNPSVRYNGSPIGNVSPSDVARVLTGQAAAVSAFRSPPPPPAAPQALPAFNVTGTGFIAEWNSSAGASGYQLDVSTDPSFATFVIQNMLVNSSSTPKGWDVLDLTPGVTYYYRLRAYNVGGTSPNSNVVAVTTIGPPTMLVSNSAGISSYGVAGGPFTSSGQQYGLQATTGSVGYAIGATPSWPSWLTASAMSGTLTTSPTYVSISVNYGAANSLPAGTYTVSITFTNTSSGRGNTTRTATLKVYPSSTPQLVISPATGITSTGLPGGPFTPSSFQLQLKASTGTANFSIAGVPSWLSASTTSGIATTAGTPVTLTVNSSANSFAFGVYSAPITITNSDTGLGNQTLSASLAVQSGIFQILSNPPGYATISATSMSKDGHVVVGTACNSCTTTNVPVRWVDGVPSVLALSSYTWVQNMVTNADGSVVYGYVSGGSGSATTMQWTISGGLTFAVPLSVQLDPMATNADGSVLISNDPASRWTSAAGVVSLPRLNGYTDGSDVDGINSDGSVAVGDSQKSLGGGYWDNEAVRWTTTGGSTQVLGLGFLSGHNYSTAQAVNADGTVIVGMSWPTGGGPAQAGFRWANGSIASLGNINPQAITADGNTVFGPAFDGSGAMRWTPVHGLETISSLLAARGARLNNIYLNNAFATSSDGSFVLGSGYPFSSPSGFYWFAKISGAIPGRSAATHDINGDGKSDIVWRDQNGNTALWTMNSGSILSSGGLGGVPNAWSIVGQRDFDGDGKYDLLWRDSSGNTAIWFMNGAQVSSTASLGNIPPAWSVAGTGDFNGDGRGDILWRDTSGNTAIWLMNGAALLSAGGLGVVPLNWNVAAIGDFNADGMSDIVWRDTSGDSAMWLMNGAQPLSAFGLAHVPPAWSVAGSGDFNGDGISDIVWRDTSGNTGVWLMNSGAILSSGGFVVPTTWSIVETGDYDGDGKTDLLWRDTSGNTAIWFMNGTTVASAATVGNIPTNWIVQSAGAD
jgi:probable HAF family extracellular repeat protein